MRVCAAGVEEGVGVGEVVGVWCHCDAHARRVVGLVRLSDRARPPQN